MKNRERFLNTLNFKPVDRLPVIEWANWWDKTIDRWKKEGLPNDLVDPVEIREYFGLDRGRQWWIGTKKSLRSLRWTIRRLRRYRSGPTLGS